MRGAGGALFVLDNYYYQADVGHDNTIEGCKSKKKMTKLVTKLMKKMNN